MIHQPWTPEQLRFLHAIDEDAKRFIALFTRMGIKFEYRLSPLEPPKNHNVIPIKVGRKLRVVK